VPPELPCARRTGAGAQATRGDPRAALSWDVGTRAAGIRGAPGAALRREAGGGAQTTCGGPGAIPSQSHRDTRHPRSCPRAGRRVPEQRGHAAAPELPRAGLLLVVSGDFFLVVTY
jgi:hypothetical protein